MTTESDGGSTQKAKVCWIFRFPGALTVWTFGILFIIASRVWQEIVPPLELFSPERIPYLLTFIGTIFGALGAISKDDEVVTSRLRDRFALWGWAAISVGAFAALVL